MPPHKLQTESWVLYESDLLNDGTPPPPVPPSAEKRKWEIVWRNVVMYAVLHLGAVYGAYLLLTQALWTTRIFKSLLSYDVATLALICYKAYVLYLTSSLGLSAGVHRLWSHKSYKVKLPLHIILVVFNTIAYQKSILHWARDHRTHHKYSETDADPHNATRGLFFSHIGWLLVKKHPDVKAKGRNIDISDLRADPLLNFQDKYYDILATLACFILPTYIPTLWGESLWNAFFVAGIFRYVFVLNITFLVNSAAHKWGNRPYDKNIKAVDQSLLSFVVLGDGFHNYHHTFPWDYKTSEFGNYSLNFTNLFIDTMARIGWAYDLKTVSDDVIKKRMKRTGDGQHHEWSHEEVQDHTQ